MRVHSLKISDILSIQNAEIQFEETGLILVEGWNFDDNKANGAGKTAMFNALSFCLYNDLPRKITASEILRDGCKKGFVECVISINEDEYIVRRERPTNFTVSKNGVLIPMSQEQFEALIQLNYNQFLISMYSAQSEGKKFIQLNDTDKKDFLLRLMNLDSFTDAKKYIDGEIKILTNKKILKDREIHGALSKINTYKESYIDVSFLVSDIKKAKETITLVTTEIMDLQKIQKPDESTYIDKENNLFKKISLFADVKFKRETFSKEYNKLINNIKPFSAKDPDGNCPHCEQAINIGNGGFIKPDDTASLQAAHEEHNSQMKEHANQIKLKIDACDDLLKKEQDVRKELNEIRQQKFDASAEYDKANARIGELKSFLSKRTSDVKHLTDKMNDMESLDSKISELEKQYAIDMVEFTDLSAKIEEHEILSNIYSPTGAPAYVMDSIIDSFNDSVGKYVDMVWPSAAYKLQTFKQNKAGDLSTKFSETLTINSNTKSVGSLSGGERRLLSLCIDFAVIDILDKNFNIKLNPIILDEPFEHLDVATREMMLNMLEVIASERQVLVIDHATEFKALFPKSIKVEKRAGISTIMIE